MTDQYEERASLAVRMLRVHLSCPIEYDGAREAKKRHLFASLAKEAEDRMNVFAKVPDACAFYCVAIDKVGDALWWVEHDEYEARDRLVGFYRLLDDVVDANLVPKRK